MLSFQKFHTQSLKLLVSFDKHSLRTNTQVIAFNNYVFGELQASKNTADVLRFDLQEDN
jgi:hypothetical protein